MSSLYITEFSSLGSAISASSANITAQMATVPPIAEQKIAIGASTQSAAFNTATRFVKLHAEDVCSVAWGANPTATTDNMRLVSGQTEYFAVLPGMKVAVVTNT